MRKNVLLGVMVVLGVWCLLYVGIKIDMWRLGYEMDDLESRRTVLRKEQEQLQVRLSALTDPQRISKNARDQLGLVIPQEGQIVMVSFEADPSSEMENRSPVRLVKEFSDALLGLR